MLPPLPSDFRKGILFPDGQDTPSQGEGRDLPARVHAGSLLFCIGFDSGIVPVEDNVSVGVWRYRTRQYAGLLAKNR